MKRSFGCGKCGKEIKFSWIWIIGIETVLRCSACGTIYRTGYKKGAFLTGFSLALSVTTMNLIVWLIGSRALFPAVIAIIPLWIFFGFLFRRTVILYKSRTVSEKSKTSHKAKN